MYSRTYTVLYDMGQEKSYIRQKIEIGNVRNGGKYASQEDFVLEKGIFDNIFERDIRRVFIYKKAERLAKAIHLILPAFAESVSLRNRIDVVAIGLIDAALLPPSAARTGLSRELLALSSILSIAHGSGLLSSMNTELITRETRLLLQEIAGYEEPRLSFDESPTLADIARHASERRAKNVIRSASPRRAVLPQHAASAGDIKDTHTLSDIHIKDRRESILSVVKDKGTASIKDISTLVRGISEKTIQRELSTLIGLGMLKKQGERRWSTYSLAPDALA